MITVVIADDHLMLREGFKTLLRKEKEIMIVGEATNGIELLSLVASLTPDVVITDIAMPELNGLEATKKIRSSFPQTSVIALSMHTENSMVIDMLKAGARGYLTKNTSRDELVNAIITVADGATYFSQETSVPLASLIDKNHLNPYRYRQPVELTSKEKSIIQLICQEHSSKQIAPLVKLTKRTVDSYREKIQEKIEAKNVVGIVMYAIRNGLYSVD